MSGRCVPHDKVARRKAPVGVGVLMPRLGNPLECGVGNRVLDPAYPSSLNELGMESLSHPASLFPKWEVP